jgi:hypothetical protein
MLTTNRDQGGSHCGICHGVIGSGLSICSECENAFDSDPEAQVIRELRPLDLEQYSCPLFPWEQGRNHFRLICAHPAWLLLALGLVVLVVLLALLRTPLPSCWEIAF